MGLGLHHRLCVLLGDPTMWRDVVTLYACKCAGKKKPSGAVSKTGSEVVRVKRSDHLLSGWLGVLFEPFVH